MDEQPFKCSNCGNWYIKVPTKGECWSCVEDKHGRHLTTGVVDCHFGQQSATPSEMRIAEVLQVCQRATQVFSDLAKAEQAFAAAEMAESQIPDILKWAGVMEMPGQQASKFQERYKTVESLRLLVEDSRRPPEDVETLERSIAVCEKMAHKVPALMARARLAIGQARRALGTPQPSEEETPDTQDAAARARMAHARAARVSKQAAAKAGPVTAELAPA